MVKKSVKPVLKIKEFGIVHTISSDPVYQLRIKNKYNTKTTVKLNCPDSVRSYLEYWEDITNSIKYVGAEFAADYIADNFFHITIPTSTLNYVKDRVYELFLKHFTLKLTMFCWYYKKDSLSIVKAITSDYAIRDSIRAEIVRILGKG